MSKIPTPAAAAHLDPLCNPVLSTIERSEGETGGDLIKLVFPKLLCREREVKPAQARIPTTGSESTEERERNLVGRVGKDLVQAGGGNTNRWRLEI